MSPITTHVLDTNLGSPAAGLAIELLSVDAEGNANTLANGVTNDDGRIADLLAAGSLIPGRYRMVFDTGGYFAKLKTATFYPMVQVDFEIVSTDQHYHVPLLLSPFGYSTYRGS